MEAQVILPTSETAFESQHNFNPEIIKTKGIKKITFEIIDKKDFEVAVDKSLTETYEFNTDGKLARFYYTNIIKTKEKQITKVDRRGNKTSYCVNEFVYDTVSTTYFYAGNNLILKRHHDGLAYYESRYYRYDTSGNLTKELRFKETNNSPDKSFFILGNQVLLSEDSFQYTKYSSGQVKCTFLNNENRPYKERISNFDSLGRKKNESEHYTAASWIQQNKTFEYKNNHLVSAQFEGNTGNKVSIKNTYEYDELNELYTEKHYKNGELQREISYVTIKLDTLLNSFIVRDPANKSLRIVKLKYDFGMIGKNGK
ncbi:hypothetical protein [Aurantibacillus circumpalustris]|uniref:hypothetical protein n=1 Tax=Aurantibacillus circumpalustris TaxID=3036359 RepID=UPI00295B273B|nr:hypothetical protein [Aurantibacillus circumpalustris]